MSPEQRELRIAVCRDVLAQLDHPVRPIRLRQMCYVSGPVDLRVPDEAFLDHIQERCEVCLVGALLLSWRRVSGQPHRGLKSLFVESPHKGDGMFRIPQYRNHDGLSQVFSPVEIVGLERAFEANPRSNHSGSSTCRFWHFGLQHQYLPERVRAIMNNVIANQGEFKP